MQSPPARVQSRLDELLEKGDPAEPDRPFADAIAGWRRAGRISDAEQQGFLGYVGGFHAADPARLGLAALKEVEAASEEDGERQYRFDDGYAALVRWLHARLDPARVTIRLGTIVRGANGVTVHARQGGTTIAFSALQVVVTLPLGVLKAEPGVPGAVTFEPALPSWQDAFEPLEMGNAERWCCDTIARGGPTAAARCRAFCTAPAKLFRCGGPPPHRGRYC
ncbi:MAG: FAD-dependent oxidoreductase [Gemmatimonadales bacterium]|nr:FAD-dependent oxidoreductase [Gemmatimonadales bacterium]